MWRRPRRLLLLLVQWWLCLLLLPLLRRRRSLNVLLHLLLGALHYARRHRAEQGFAKARDVGPAVGSPESQGCC